MTAQQRKHFRIVYPFAEQPTLVFGKEKLKVIDLSEQGVRFEKPTVSKVGMPITATIEFSDKTKVKIVGKVIRENSDGTAIALLTEGVPLPLIMKEQRRMLQIIKQSK